MLDSTKGGNMTFTFRVPMGLSILIVLVQIVLIALKLAGGLSVAWLVILSPALFVSGLWFLFLVIVLIGLVIK